MRVALTGGIADGKTTVLGFLGEAGFPTLEADTVVRELQAEPGYLDAIRDVFGERLVSEARLNREVLRDLILANPVARWKLNELTHGPAMRRMLDWSKRQSGPSFVEIPLLIETCTQGWFDQVWVVSAGVEAQRKRLIERVGDPESATRLLSSQLNTEVKAAFADVLHRTNMPLDAVRCTVTRTLEELGLIPGQR